MTATGKGRVVLLVGVVAVVVAFFMVGLPLSGPASRAAAADSSTASSAGTPAEPPGGVASPYRGNQPIAYNHKIHTQDLQLTCVTCHRQVETGEVAGRPSIKTCLECHETAVTDKAEEHKIQQFAAAGLDIPWVRLTNLPRHVFFSHRRHVTVARLECAECHGHMELRTTPPAGPLKPIRMSICIDCHQKRGASVDCNACHR